MTTFQSILITTFYLVFCVDIAAAADSVGTIDQVKGVVSVNGNTVTTGNEFSLNSTISTSGSGAAVLRFKDGQFIALSRDTIVRLNSYHYNQSQPTHSSLNFELVDGAIRFASESNSSQPRDRVSMESKVASVTTSGGDFIAMSDSLYVSVASGVVTVSNTSGSLSFATGQTAYIASRASLPAGINSAQIPDGLKTAFSELGAVQAPFSTIADRRAVGQSAGASGGSFKISATAVAIGLGVAGALAALASGDSNTAVDHDGQ